MNENPNITIRGAHVNNLKNISVDIPRDKFIVVTGVSGSGKSSLAFDTLYAEGQRRYVESLNTYARQFLGRMHKPECDFIEGIPPAIAIEQKVTSRNPRSTVGTSTEIYDYLRMLFARVGRTYSPISGKEVTHHTVTTITQVITELPEATRIMLFAPITLQEGRTMEQQVEIYNKEGYTRIEQLKSDDGTIKPHLLIDRIVVRHDQSTVDRLSESLRTALYEGHGKCAVAQLNDKTDISKIEYYSTLFEADGMTFEEPSEYLFSFNSPMGACPECEGFGQVIGIDEHLVIPNPELSVMDGAVICWRGEKMGEWKKEFIRRAERNNFPIFTPYYGLTEEQKSLLWHGRPGEDLTNSICIDAFFEMLRQNQYKIQYRVMLAHYRGKTTCPKCKGSRLRHEAGYVKIGGKNIMELIDMPISNLRDWFANLQLNEHDNQIAKRLLTEIRSRLEFLCDVGLEYLTLNRKSNTLSGGESQRINLTSNLGSSLVGSLYILDEPSIGLHPRDTQRLISVLQKLKDAGNTVVVVEHDEEIMRAADYIIDIGPDAGRNGGEIVWQGDASDVEKYQSHEIPSDIHSHTLDYLTHREIIEVPKSRRPWNNYIEIKGARENNLKGIDVKFPLNVLTAVTGVSGSGKSTLIRDILYPAMKRQLDQIADRPGIHSALTGDLDMITKIDFVDQNPIGTSSRSNAVTYTGAYDEIRKLMASQQLSKQMNYTPAYFSFNQEGGRCEECKGEGTVTVEMQFMNDLVLECESCHGKRFKDDILEVKYFDQNIYDILNLTVNQAVEFFTEHGQKKIIQKLRPLQDVGLGYIKLGQNSSSLSGGENQRVKLAYYLSQEKTSPTLFIFDEPTTGLHFHDIKRLMAAFSALISRGHTVIVIEHNIDVIKCADHIIDLGPEGGLQGGEIVVQGTPEQVAQCPQSFTGKFLKEKLR